MDNLLKTAIDAHGGLERWNGVQSIFVKASSRELSGSSSANENSYRLSTRWNAHYSLSCCSAVIQFST
jgi:hypothetical protein